MSPNNLIKKLITFILAAAMLLIPAASVCADESADKDPYSILLSEQAELAEAEAALDALLNDESASEEDIAAAEYAVIDFRDKVETMQASYNDYVAEPEVLLEYRPISVCIIGNSYCNRHSLGTKLKSYLEAKGYTATVVTYAEDDVYLYDWVTTSMLNELKSGRYDAVILQEESHYILECPDDSAYYAGKLAAAARTGGAEVFLYQTMSYKDDGEAGQPVYTKAYDRLASAINAQVCRCGEAFWDYKSAHECSMDEMFDDWQHPWNLGCKVVAKCMANTIAPALVSQFEVTFSDVPESGKYYSTPVYWAAAKGIVDGYADGTFGVGRTCPRLTFAVILWRYAGRPTTDKNGNAYGDARNMFNDMSSYGKYAETNRAVAWAYKEGIVKGFSDGGFHPKDKITRKDAMIMFYRLAGKPKVSGTVSFIDLEGIYSPKSDTYKAILWGAQNGITKGYSSGTYAGQFGVALKCKREDVITFLYRYDGL